MRQEYLILFIGMTIVTYIPRLLPYYLFDSLNIPEYIEQPLKLLPCAAIGAFLFPGGITLYSEALYIAPLGLITGAILTWKTESIPLGVFSSILVVLLIM